jgi:AraC family transcriptional regulator
LQPVIEKVYDEMPFIPENVETYQFEDIAVFRPNVVINDKASFSNYHFIITGNHVDLPPFKVDNKINSLNKNRIFSLNPGQVITSSEFKEVGHYLAVYVDTDFINRIFESMGGKSRVVFTNDCNIPNNGIVEMIEFFIDENKKCNPGFELMLQTLNIQIAVNIIRYVNNNLLILPQNYNNCRKDNIKRAIEYIRENYYNSFSIDNLSHIANLSTYHFIRVFKTETGKTPYEFLLDIKVEKAIELIKAKKYTLTEIAMMCGFTSSSHFSSVFRKITGTSPTEFIKDII